MKEILKKYLNNNCSEQEFEQFAEWVKNEALSKEGKAMVFDDWKSFNLANEDEGNNEDSILLDKIHHKINLQERIRYDRKILSVPKIAMWATKAAAVLFLPLLSVVFYLSSDKHFQSTLTNNYAVDSLEIIAPIGSRTVLQLSDGTIVNLNYGSRIKYPSVFSGNSREVRLEGEGFFDVAHNSDKPFIVKTSKLNVKALGTKFNVQAYKGENVVATTLVEGKVALEKVNLGSKNKSLGIMVPGQHVNYNASTGALNSSKGKIEKYIGWVDGKMVFDNESLQTVAEKLSRMYNVEIYVEPDVFNYTYTVTFIDEPLYLILDLMTEITPIKYHILPRKKLLNGTYSKQKIRIEKRL